MTTFISHSSKDKNTAMKIASRLKRADLEVWYDGWEISVGDSITDKVFDGLEKSDFLVVLLSVDSVKSRWVSEELSVSLMRKISQQSIRILPIILDDCDVPYALSHIRYADFRANFDEGMSDLLETISPGHAVWEALTGLQASFLASCKILRAEADTTKFVEAVPNIHQTLEAALNLRVDIEERKAKRDTGYLGFFEKIGFLHEMGVDVRSETWNRVVHARAVMAHEMASSSMNVQMISELIFRGSEIEKQRAGLSDCLDRLVMKMEILCSNNSQFTDVGLQHPDSKQSTESGL